MKIVYLSRKDWRARTDIPRLGRSVAPHQRTEVFIHHTVVIDLDATPNVWGTLEQVKAKMRQLQTIRPDLGLDVPYSYVIFFMIGQIVICEGRGAMRTGAHTKYHNTVAIGMAVQGNFNLATFGLLAYLPAIGEWLHRLKVTALPNLGSKHPPGRDCYGHRDVSQTACPGNNLYANLSHVKIQAPVVPPPVKEDDMMVFISEKGRPEVYLLGYPLEHIENPTHLAILIKTAKDAGVEVKRVILPAGHDAFKKLDRTHRPNN